MANKSLHRIIGTETQFGGVTLGLAEYLNIDVTLVRVLFVILVFTPFPAIITYLILWAVLPAYSSITQLDTEG
ncbi:MAG: PspC domain-containing protein, partial [Spirosomaceae bacterium]|nr:PspC domain-containing protein [Spirosomataceae bacterium]